MRKEHIQRNNIVVCFTREIMVILNTFIMVAVKRNSCLLRGGQNVCSYMKWHPAKERRREKKKDRILPIRPRWVPFSTHFI